MTSVIDHVIVCVPDLDGSVAAFETEHKVTSVPGGRHRGHGTGNRLIPLGGKYIELVAVIDGDEARGERVWKMGGGPLPSGCCRRASPTHR